MPKYGNTPERDTIDELYRRGDKVTAETIAVRQRSHVGVWINPALVNGYANPGTPYCPAQYRKVFNDHLEFRGHLDISGASSGTVAFTLVRSHWQIHELTFLIDVFDGVSTFTVARVSISSTTGGVTLTWPAA